MLGGQTVTFCTNCTPPPNWLPLKSLIVASLSESFPEGYPVSVKSQTLRQNPLSQREWIDESNVLRLLSLAPATALLASLATPVWFAQKMGAPKAARTAARGLARTGAS